MKDAALAGGHGQLPFALRLGIEAGFLGYDNSIHAEPRQNALRSAFVFKQKLPHPGGDFAMNGKCELAGHARRTDRAVPVDQLNPAPHRSAADTRRRAERFRSFLDAIRMLGRRIDAEIETLWVERSRLGQFLGEIVLGDAAIGRKAKVGGQ